MLNGRVVVQRETNVIKGLDLAAAAGVYKACAIMIEGYLNYQLSNRNSLCVVLGQPSYILETIRPGSTVFVL